jgi:hypothetical protein
MFNNTKYIDKWLIFILSDQKCYLWCICFRGSYSNESHMMTSWEMSPSSSILLEEYEVLFDLWQTTDRRWKHHEALHIVSSLLFHRSLIESRTVNSKILKFIRANPSILYIACIQEG